MKAGRWGIYAWGGGCTQALLMDVSGTGAVVEGMVWVQWSEVEYRCSSGRGGAAVEDGATHAQKFCKEPTHAQSITPALILILPSSLTYILNIGVRSHEYSVVYCYSHAHMGFLTPYC